MMAYVNYIKLLNEVANVYGAYSKTFITLSEIIDKYVSADVVEVPYRCGTCIRKEGTVNECGDVYCTLHKGYFDRDAFCSYGERRDT